jgi:hypothetical protein
MIGVYQMEYKEKQRYRRCLQGIRRLLGPAISWSSSNLLLRIITRISTTNSWLDILQARGEDRLCLFFFLSLLAWEKTVAQEGRCPKLRDPGNNILDVDAGYSFWSSCNVACFWCFLRIIRYILVCWFYNWVVETKLAFLRGKIVFFYFLFLYYCLDFTQRQNLVLWLNSNLSIFFNFQLV